MHGDCGTMEVKALLQLNFPFDAIFQQNFSASKKLKTKMRSIPHNNRLSHLKLMYVYQEKLIKFDICKITSEFSARNDLRKEQFSFLQIL